MTWFVGDNLLELSDHIFLHPNNSLEIRDVDYDDRAQYTCQAVNTAGIASDTAALLVYGSILSKQNLKVSLNFLIKKINMDFSDAPQALHGSMEGHINGHRMATQPLFANITPMVGSNEIHMRYDQMPSQLGSILVYRLFYFVKKFF